MATERIPDKEVYLQGFTSSGGIETWKELAHIVEGAHISGAPFVQSIFLNSPNLVSAVVNISPEVNVDRAADVVQTPFQSGETSA